MTEEVLLTISTLQSFEGQKDTVESSSPARYYKKDESHYVFCEETNEEQCGTVKTRIKLSGKTVELKRNGAVSTSMIFEKNKKYPVMYRTPYGSLELTVETESMEMTETEEEIRACIVYTLQAEGTHMADCHLSLSITQK